MNIHHIIYFLRSIDIYIVFNLNDLVLAYTMNSYHYIHWILILKIYLKCCNIINFNTILHDHLYK